MLKKFLIFVCLLFSFGANAAQVANIEYVHKLIAQEHGIEIPYNPELKNVQAAANMKYLLTAVDVANHILNGGNATSYGMGEFATEYAADIVATQKAVKDLVKKYKFFVTTTPDTESFEFSISKT